MTNYVLGGGVAGIIFSYLSGHTLIDPNPMGQLGAQHILGPRLMACKTETEQFLNQIKHDNIINTIEIRESRIGYQNKNIIAHNFDSEFKEKYLEIARGTQSQESSFLSEGKNIISHFVVDGKGTGLSYNYLIQKLLLKLKEKNLVIEDKINHIDIKNKKIHCNDGEFHYDSIVNTLPVYIFADLINYCDNNAPIHHLKKTLIHKNFAITQYCEENTEISSRWHYVYNINGIYTRKTFYSDYIVFETLYQCNEGDVLENCSVIKVYNNLPIQIKNSLCIEYYVLPSQTIPMLGRYAQWDHSVKFNEMVTRSLLLTQQSKDGYEV